jgi:hypothetical protein
LMSFPPGTEMFQFPGFASRAYGFGPRYPIAGVGCPIRRSPDRSPLAAPRGLSQRATSFVASWRQGIHQMPFLSLDPAQRQPRRPRARGTAPPPRRGQATTRAKPRACIPMPRTRRARETERPKKKRARRDKHACQRPSARDARGRREAPRLAPCLPRPRTGTLSRHHTMCKERKDGRTGGPGWWAWADLNGRPHAYQACALTG